MQISVIIISTSYGKMYVSLSEDQSKLTSFVFSLAALSASFSLLPHNNNSK